MRRTDHEPKSLVVLSAMLGMAVVLLFPLNGRLQAQSPAGPAKNMSAASSLPTSPASNSDKAAELPMTQAQGAAILDELRRIEKLLSTREDQANSAINDAAPVRIKIEPGWYSLGREDAQVVMIEFTDLQCSFCRRFHATTFPQLKSDYIDAGKMRFVTLDLPLPIHPYAREAAEAARCAGAQGKFWVFRAAVLNAEDPPTPDELTTEARNVGLDFSAFTRCRELKQFAADIKGDENNAIAAGITGTPSFVIGRVDNGWLEGTKVRGNRPYTTFQAIIEGALNPSANGEPRAK